MITRRAPTDQGFYSHCLHCFDIVGREFIDHFLSSHSNERPAAAPLLLSQEGEIYLRFLQEKEDGLRNGVSDRIVRGHASYETGHLCFFLQIFFWRDSGDILQTEQSILIGRVDHVFSIL